MPVVRTLALAFFIACALSACAKSDSAKEEPASANNAVIASTPLNATLDSLVAESMRDGKVPGLALSIVRNDSLIHSKGYGFANLEAKIAMTDTTPVVIGSTSKTFTSFALMQLVDSGRVSLDSSASRYIGVLGGGSAKAKGATPADLRFAKITVRHLLTNVSGIPAGFSGDAYDNVDTTTDALVRLVRDDMIPRRLDFAPGAGYKYSNRGFSLASLVVQDVSGMSYEDYVATHIFEPLGMTHRTGRFWEGKSRGMAQGYRESVDGKPLPRPASLGREWTGSGMILSTTRDISRYLQTFLDSGRAPNGRQVLSASSVAEILRPQQKAESELGGPTMYGLGWEISNVNGMSVAQKGGSVSTMGSLFILVPAQRLGIALVFNDIDYGKVGLLQNVLKALMGAPTAPYQSMPPRPKVPPSTFTMPAAKQSSFAGVYDTRSGILRLTMHGDTLAGRFEGENMYLEPSSDTSFIMRSAVAEQEGTSMTIKKCGKSMCIWMKGDSAAVRR